MASEQGTVDVPQEKVEEVKPEETVTDAAPAAEPEETFTDAPVAAEPEETSTDAAPAAEPETTSGEEAPPKVSTKEKITGIIHQTGDKIKGTVTGIKEKVGKK